MPLVTTRFFFGSTFRSQHVWVFGSYAAFEQHSFVISVTLVLAQHFCFAGSYVLVEQQDLPETATTPGAQHFSRFDGSYNLPPQQPSPGSFTIFLMQQDCVSGLYEWPPQHSRLVPFSTRFSQHIPLAGSYVTPSQQRRRAPFRTFPLQHNSFFGLYCLLAHNNADEQHARMRASATVVVRLIVSCEWGTCGFLSRFFSRPIWSANRSCSCVLAYPSKTLPISSKAAIDTVNTFEMIAITEWNVVAIAYRVVVYNWQTVIVSSPLLRLLHRLGRIGRRID